MKPTPSIFRHTFKNSLEHGRAAWQHDIGEKLLADVHVTLHVALERSVVDSTDLNADETGWENTRETETFGAKRDDVWELVGLTCQKIPWSN